MLSQHTARIEKIVQNIDSLIETKMNREQVHFVFLDGRIHHQNSEDCLMPLLPRQPLGPDIQAAKRH